MSTGKVNLFGDRLRGMQERTTEIMEGYTPGGILVPEAVYIGKEECELGETSEKGYLKISRRFTVAEGEYAGMLASDGFVLEGNDFGIMAARRWVEQHGCAWPESDLSELESIINQINEASPTVKFKVRYKASKDDPDSKWCNISILQILDGLPNFGNAEEAPVVETVEEAVDEPITDEFDGMNRNQLKKYIADNDLEIRVTTKFTDDDIRNAIREKVSPAEEIEEVEPEAEPEETPDNTELLAFCASQGVENVDDTMTTEEIVVAMSNYGFEEPTLTDDEKAMLTSLGLEANIIKPEPKPEPKKAVAAPAKKAPATAAAATKPPVKAPAPAPKKAPAPAKKK